MDPVAANLFDFIFAALAELATEAEKLASNHDINVLGKSFDHMPGFGE